MELLMVNLMEYLMVYFIDGKPLGSNDGTQLGPSAMVMVTIIVIVIERVPVLVFLMVIVMVMVIVVC